jgi:hypothetical protein
VATKTENIQYDQAHFNHFRKYINSLKHLDQATIDIMLDQGLLQVSTAYEHALADLGGYQVVSEDGRDLNDPCNSDAKLSSVRTSDKQTRYTACIGNVHGKIGSLRVCVYERKLNKFYYFHIPRAAYQHITSTSNIEIPFDQSGSPKRVNKSTVNWWDYEEHTFDDLACQMTDPKTRRMERNMSFFRTINHTGGRKTGSPLSMTPNAIRKRAARAAGRATC